MSNKGSVVREEKISYQPLLGPYVSMESPKIEETTIQTVPDVHPFVNIQVHSSLLEHPAEEYAEEGRCLDTALLHAVGDR